MDAPPFDQLDRSLISNASRRGFLSSLAAAIGLAAMRFSGGVEAKKKRKNKQPKKLKRNAFGCVDVGGPCRGNSANCCSGICERETPKQGKKDASRCVAHDTGGCQAGQSSTGCGASADVPCTTTTGLSGSCLTTTGNGGYCFFDGSCRPCRRDADCQAEFGPQAACAVCADCVQGTICAVPDDRIGD